MKKFISAFLSLIMLTAATLPAYAESPVSSVKPVTTASFEGSDTADSRLAAVTLKVKETLGVANHYTNFYGNLQDSVYGSRWQLNWSKDNENLSVQADENGKIYSMNYYSYDDTVDYDYYSYYRKTGFKPQFPDVTRAEGAAAAQAFADKVLGENEKVSFDAVPESPYIQSSYSYNGYLTINGVKSTIRVSLTVRTSDLKVTYYYRDDSYYYIDGDIPSPDAKITSEQALEKYKTIFGGKAEYAIVDDSKVAKLIYYISQNGNYIVDAKTGELVKYEDYRMYDKASGIEMPVAEAAYDKADVYLTDTELKGVSYLEGALTAEQLDAIIKAEPAFGVTADYTMSGLNYYVVDSETGDIEVSFNYTKKITDFSGYGYTAEEWANLSEKEYKPQIYKSFRLNGKTGEVKSLYTNYMNFPWKEGKTTEANISKTAADYLNKRFSEYMSKTQLYSSSANNWNVETYSFTYSQSVNGYFYPGNSIYVTTNALSGTIDSLSYNWDEDITFTPVSKVISEPEAVASYLKPYTADLSYSLVPVKTDDYNSNLYNMILGYQLNSSKYIRYIDAATGEAVYYDWYDNSLTLSYNDLNGAYAKDKILKLAEYGIGYYARNFLPDKQLTELDMLLFFISTEGYKYEYDKLDEDTRNTIYATAYNLGILTKGQKEPDRKITRAELARSFVSMAGYSEVAELKGIYRCDFTDEAQIAEKDYGYVAIAKGYGFISGDPSGAFRPNDTITRQEFAVMMYNFMSR
jgi:hypothetical protein